MAQNGTELLTNTIRTIDEFAAALKKQNPTKHEEYLICNNSVEIARSLFKDFETNGDHQIQEIAEILLAMCQPIINRKNG